MICISIFFNHISSNTSWTFSKSLAENLNILRVFLCLTGLSSEHRIPPSVILFGPSEWFPGTIHEGNMVFSIFIIKFYNFPHIPLTVIYCCNTCICSILPYKLSLTSKFTSCWKILSGAVSASLPWPSTWNQQRMKINNKTLPQTWWLHFSNSQLPLHH